eukprot:13648068-Alexandrium_andersonii.AAC.1
MLVPCRNDAGYGVAHALRPLHKSDGEGRIPRRSHGAAPPCPDWPPKGSPSHRPPGGGPPGP